MMVYVTAVLKVGLELVSADVSEKRIHLIPSLLSLHSLSYHVIIENTVYSWTHWYLWVGYEDGTKQPDMAHFVYNTPSCHLQHLGEPKVWGLYLKDLSQNWQGYGRPAPPSSSPPVAMPRSQQPSGICEGDATSLLEGEEGTQDSPAGSSSPSDRQWNRHRKLKK